MSWVRIWVHLVFTTKNRTPYLNSEALRINTFEHIHENAKEKGIRLDCIGGYQKHAHCLISIGKEQTISKLAQLIKGESSFWINKNHLTTNKFSWQDDYWCVGVSESHVTAVRQYIQRQEAHHRKQTFQQEVDAFMREYGWDIIQE